MTSKSKIFHTIKSKYGFTLVEMMFGGLAMAAVTLAAGRLLFQVQNSQRDISSNEDIATIKALLITRIDCKSTLDNAGINPSNIADQCLSGSMIGSEQGPYFHLSHKPIMGQDPRDITGPLNDQGYGQYRDYWIRASCSGEDQSLIVRAVPDGHDFNTPLDKSFLLFGSPEQDAIPLCFDELGNAPTPANPRQIFFAITHAGNLDVSLKEILAESQWGLELGEHPMGLYDFKNQPFKIYVGVRLLSMINYRVAGYSESDVELLNNGGVSASIERIERSAAERTYADAQRNSRCVPVPESVFSSEEVSETSLNHAPVISLATEPEGPPLYVFSQEARDRFSRGNQPCYPSVHSSRHSRVGSLISSPPISGSYYPYRSDGYSNTYGNGAYVYVTDDGQLRFRYVTQRSSSRVVFLVGVSTEP